MDETTVGEIYTQVALTLSAQAPLASATSMPTLTSFPTIASLPTSLRTSTPASSSASYVSTGSNAVGCDNSAYLSDVTIPDGTVLTPGSAFTKTWSLQNTGSCDWTTSYSIVFYSGNSMSGATTALSAAVSPGGSTDVSVSLTAPSTSGSYTGYWRLQNASGTSFGEAVYVQIAVSGSTPTPTSTSTATDESEEEATSTPTSTTSPTETPVPTATETPSS
ncbi:MAG: hypothetical protein HYZ22_11200 [Chloroflexi bacterium]|nr:hypothetical protein [Chloroflexota bacterium]